MRVARVALALGGIAGIAYGFVGLASHQPVGNLFSQAIFLAVVVFAHDAVVLPVALAIGVVTARWAPARCRGPLRGALYISAVLTFVALPFIVGAGRSADNPSALPLNYGRGLGIAVLVIWTAAGVVAARRWRVRPDRVDEEGDLDAT